MLVCKEVHFNAATPMITVISGTNRANSKSILVARLYQRLLDDLETDSRLADLSLLPDAFTAAHSLYESQNRHAQFDELSNLISTGIKFVIIVPEYNGSFPGVLKAFIDGLEFPASFKNKKVGLIGISEGSMGGALAMSHLTDIFNYLGAEVFSYKPRLQGIKNCLLEGKLTDPKAEGFLREHSERFIRF